MTREDDWARRVNRASLGIWRGLALLGEFLGVCSVRGWPGPGRCTALGARAAHASFLAGALVELLTELWYVYMFRMHGWFSPVTAIGMAIFSFHMLALWGMLWRRRALADVSECLRLYRECHDAPSARDAAAQLVLALWVLLAVVMFTWKMHVGRWPTIARSIVSEVGGVVDVVHKVKWVIAVALMLYPMLVEGSLAADVRRSCVRLAKERLGLQTPKATEDATHGALAWRALRLRQHELYDMTTASFGIYQERILLVVVSTLLLGTSCLATSILDDGEPIAMAVKGLNYCLSLAMLGSICQFFFIESACIGQALHDFLVQTGSRQDREIVEVSMFIKQIEQQRMYSIWGVFQVDTSFTCGVLVATTTYVALLCQMKMALRS